MNNEEKTRSRRIELLDAILSRVAIVIGGILLAFMTILSTVNVVIMRKALNAPIRGGEDLMVLALVLTVAVAVAFGARTGAHVEIELLDVHLGQRASRMARGAMKLVGAAVVCLLATHLWIAGGQASRFGEATQQLVISFGPFYRALAIGVGIYALVLLVEFLEYARGRDAPAIQLEEGEPK